MNAGPAERSLMKRRLIYVVLTALVLIGGGTLGWYYLANQLHSQVNNEIDRLALQGKQLQCENQEVKGYPFRVGLFCDTVLYESKSEKTLISTGNLRTAAQFYQPGFLVGELDSPTIIKSPNMVDMVLNWKLAKISTRLSLDGFKRLSFEATELVSTGLEGLTKDTQLAEISSLQFHARPAGGEAKSQDLELVLNGKGVRFGALKKNRNPTLRLNIDGVVFKANEALKEGMELSQWAKENGFKMQVHKLEIALESGGSISGSGPLIIGRDGLIDGNLDVAVSDIQKMVDNFTAQNPELGETAKTIQAASLLFSQGSKDGNIRMKIQIRKGVATMGFIPLGIIPPLFQ